MKELRYRFTVIALLLLGSIYALWPRPTVVRVDSADGQATRYDTVSRIPIKLGLDLRGGMYIALEPDESKGVITDFDELMERAVTIVRNRVNGIGVSEANVQKEGQGRIIVELPGISDPQRATAVVQATALLEFKIVDETNAFPRILPRIDAVLRSRGVGVEATPQPAKVDPLKSLIGADTAPDSASAADSAGVLSDIIRGGQIAGEYVVPSSQFRAAELWLGYPEVRALLPPGKEMVWGSDSIQEGNTWYRTLYVVDTRPILVGSDLVDARPFQDPTQGTRVNFTVNNVAARNFQRATQSHIGDYMAIILDNRVMGQPPVIQSAIGRDGSISMPGKPMVAATDLSLVLRAGALPIALQIVEVRQVGASLGQDSIDKGIIAGVVGLGLVIVIMLVYYRFSGFLAIVGLAFYSITTLAMLAALGAVLTLPGIAGFVLSIGMAVDANFLIFERIREELTRGKTVRTAIDEGFRHAWSAIVDTHVTTALTAVILYQFGTGPVQGFAVALLAGIASSLVSAIFVVRSLFLLWLSRSRDAQTLSI